MKTRTLAEEEASFVEVAARIEAEKAAALAAFDAQAFRAAVLSRLQNRRRPGWAGSARLIAAYGFLLALVTWAVLAPEWTRRQSIDLRVVQRALQYGEALRIAGAVPTPVEPALSDQIWTIERTLLTWRRRQGGSVDVERALCFATRLGGGSRSCPSPEARDVAAPGARERLERSLSGLERDRTIHRALVGRRRT